VSAEPALRLVGFDVQFEMLVAARDLEARARTETAAQRDSVLVAAGDRDAAAYVADLDAAIGREAVVAIERLRRAGRVDRLARRRIRRT